MDRDEMIDYLENTILNPGEGINERGSSTVLNQEYWFICSKREKALMDEQIAALKEELTEFVALKQDYETVSGLLVEARRQIAALQGETRRLYGKTVEQAEEIVRLRNALEKIYRMGLDCYDHQPAGVEMGAIAQDALKDGRGRSTAQRDHARGTQAEGYRHEAPHQDDVHIIRKRCSFPFAPPSGNQRRILGDNGLPDNENA